MPRYAPPIWITGLARTPMGAFLGALKDHTAPALGSAAIAAAVARAGSPEVDEVLMGCVLTAGLGQAPARQAALGAGLAQSVPCTTISKVCGSGMMAVMLGADRIAAGAVRVVVAGGMESMSNAPYLLERARQGLRAGHGRLMDHMFLDGLEDAYDRGRSMGTFAEDTASALGLTRVAQDAFALTSLTRARAAQASGAFASEIIAVGEVLVDEAPLRARPDRIPGLKPAFREGGTVTAANASSLSDGAAALVLSLDRCAMPLARIAGQACHAQAPAEFTTAPIPAIRKLLNDVGWSIADVDLWEINEAFAVVTLAAIQALGLDPDRVNVNGGACALGHPIGASGARIVVTLIAALRQRGLHRGIACLCIGGGEATALAIEI